MNLPFIPPGWNQPVVLAIAGAVVLGLIGAGLSGGRRSGGFGFTAPIWVTLVFLALVAGVGLWFLLNSVKMVGYDF